MTKRCRANMPFDFRVHGSLSVCIVLDEARQGILLPSAGGMARSMRLFLIRHGETVDNIAGL
jgi:hypothetical protein